MWYPVRTIAPKVGKYARSGAQGGTVFADPAFAKGMASGKLTRTAIDRFSIVLMGGIAAEAIEYGTSEVSRILWNIICNNENRQSLIYV